MPPPSVSGRFPVKQVVIDEATVAAHVLVTGVANKRIRAISLLFTVAGAVNLQWLSDATPLTGVMEFADSGGMTAASDSGLFWTGAGEDLVLDIDAAVQVSGVLTYIEE